VLIIATTAKHYSVCALSITNTILQLTLNPSIMPIGVIIYFPPSSRDLVFQHRGCKQISVCSVGESSAYSGNEKKKFGMHDG
jgi:hypothetical protein